MSERTTSWFAKWGWWVALAGASVGVLSGWGVRSDVWTFGFGFRLLSGAVVAALVGIVMCLIGLVAVRGGKKRGKLRAVLGVVVGLAAAGVPLSYIVAGRGAPLIHDITTDLENPPAFSAVVPLRRGVPNGVEYPAGSTAESQRKAYPDIHPLALAMAPNQAFERALNVARVMGWDIVDANPAGGRIEATAGTFWFGFKDDVVVRVSATETGSQIDVRSLSRVGRGDLGANARRVRSYLAQLSSER